MGDSPLRPVTFCRFGYDESLTLDQAVRLIEQKELWAGELIQTNDSKAWTAARDIARLRPYFGKHAAPPVDQRQRRPYETRPRPQFQAWFRPDLPQGPDILNAEVWQDWYLRVIGALVVVFAAAFGARSFADLIMQADSVRWPATQGTALAVWSSDESNDLNVQYEFSIARAQYRGTDRNSHVATGQTVIVHYDPQQPNRTLLTTGIRLSTAIGCLVALAVTAFGLASLFYPARVVAMLKALNEAAGQSG